MEETHLYNTSYLNWIQPQEDRFEGLIPGKLDKVSDAIHTGETYFLECMEGVTALYVDVTYKKDKLYIHNYNNPELVVIYYNLTKKGAFMTLDDKTYSVGRWKSNMVIVNCESQVEYEVKEGSKTLMLCVFLEKKVINSYLKKTSNTNKETVSYSKNKIDFRVISPKEYQFIIDLKKFNVGGNVFDIALIGTVQFLLSEYLNTLLAKETNSINDINTADAELILNAKKFLIKNSDKTFPGNAYLATKIGMSESKFRKLYKNITGDTPGVFFIAKKLQKAKELLEERKLSITQIADELSFTDASYFSKQFKNHFGILPNEFVSNL